MKRTDPPSVSNSRNRVYGVKIRFDLLFCCWCQCLVPGAFFLLLLLYFIRVSCLSRSWCCMLIEFHAHWTLDFRTIELCPMNLLIKYRSNFFSIWKFQTCSTVTNMILLNFMKCHSHFARSTVWLQRQNYDFFWILRTNTCFRKKNTTFFLHFMQFTFFGWNLPKFGKLPYKKYLNIIDI